MRRDPALVSLSRDHHQALVVAQCLKRATLETVDAAVERLRAYWERRGADHFAAEEQILLPALAQGARHEHHVVSQVLLDHLVLRHRAAVLLDDGPHDDHLEEAQALGTALAEHVRREERELFPLIEQALPRDQLDQLAELLEHAALRTTTRSSAASNPGVLDPSGRLSYGPLPGPGDSEGG